MKRFRSRLVGAAFAGPLVLASAALSHDHAHAHAPAHDAPAVALLNPAKASGHGNALRSSPSRERAPPLVTGLGDLDHPVSTRSPLAQKYFDQGLAWVYAFNHQEAVRSFRHAARLDPDLAIAHWGVALALGPNYNAPALHPDAADAARTAIETARAIAARSPSTTDGERAYIEALALRFVDAPDAKAIAPADAYANAMRELARALPDDADAATLFADAMMTPRAWRMWNADGTPAAGTGEIVATLEAVLARQPLHIGANHLYIHAIEASPDPARALPSADRLLTLAPAAGHLLHMPAHIYDRIGDHARSARANAAAIAADRAYFRELRGFNPYAGYLRHNLHFLAIAYANQGRRADALRAARAFAQAVGESVPSVPRLADYLPAVALIDVRFEQWDAILRLPAPPPAHASLRAVWHFARGMAQAGKGRLAAAKRERTALQRMLDAMAPDETWGRSQARDVFGVATRMLDGRIARLAGDAPSAIGAFTAAAAAEDALAYDEPSPWYIPAREMLAEVLLATGDRAAAKRVLQVEVARRPGNFKSTAMLEKLAG